MQQVEAVAADDLVIRIDLNGGEEGVNRRAQGGHGGHGGGEIFLCHRRGDGSFGRVEGREERAFFVGFREFHIRAEGIFHAVLLFGLRQDGVGAFVALQQVRAVFGFQEGCQRRGAVDQQRQVIIAGHGKAGVNDVMADALVFEEYFEAVVEEGEEVFTALIGHGR